MDNKNTITVKTNSTLSILGIVFIVLKLCGIITWSWKWVLAPFWIQLIIIVVLLVSLIIAFAMNCKSRWRY